MVEKTKRNSVSCKVETLKGPVSEQRLQQIAELYGRHDSKYKSVPFSRVTFNANLAGYSYHALAYDGPTLVGHYCLVPLPVLWHGDLVLGAKGEAFVVDEPYRGASVRLEGCKVPIGLALPKLVNAFALSEEVKVLLMIANEDVGRIHRAMGACMTEQRGTSWVRLLGAKVDSRRFVVRIGAQIASPLQGLIERAWRRRYGVYGNDRNCPWYGRGTQTATAGLTIPPSPDVLTWYCARGAVVLRSTANHGDLSVVVANNPREKYVEIVGFDCSSPSLEGLTAALLAAADFAAACGADRLFYTTWTDMPLVARACRRLGWLPQQRRMRLYTISTDQAVEDVNFGALFYSTF